MAASVQCRIARMAYCGDPNLNCAPVPSCNFEHPRYCSSTSCSRTPFILPYNHSEPGRLMLNHPMVSTPYSKETLERCAFWDKVEFRMTDSVYEKELGKHKNSE